jgi:transcriptional regulator with XRE-family HTH domain
MRFSDKLSKQRKNNNLSQEQLADRLGVSRQAVSKWESGSSYPDMDKIIQISKILNCTLEDLLDDGTIKGNSETKKNIKFNNYFKEFLDFITKTYNMFTSMTFKEKIKFIFEMCFITLFILILGLIFYSLAEYITHHFFNIISNYRIRNTIISFFDTIYSIILIVIGFITIIHLFKIRYLDYFITIEDQNVTDRTIEKPIEKSKEKIIIRDPKHSSLGFIEGLGKIVMLFIKFILLMMLIFVSLSFIGLVICLFYTLFQIHISTLFIFISLTIIGFLVINYIFIELFYKEIVNVKQNSLKIFIMFIIGLILIGCGIGLSISKILSCEIVEGFDDRKTVQSVEEFEYNLNTEFWLDSNNVEFVVDNDMGNNVKLEITTIKGLDYSFIKIENEGITYYRLYSYSNDSLELYNHFMEDLKNNKIHNYNNSLLKVKVILSEESYNRIK